MNAFSDAMKMKLRAGNVFVVSTLLLCGCGTQVKLQYDFPDMVTEPRDLSAVVVMDEEFRQFRAEPNDKDTILLGPAQVVALSNSFRGLFTQLEVVPSRQEIKTDADLVITPSVREVQLSSPSESYLNVYEVWIKYNLDIETADGVPIDSWFLPAYGKTPSSYLLSRSTAIEEATIVALRDAGAKLMLDFFRIPALHGWLQQRRLTEADP